MQAVQDVIFLGHIYFAELPTIEEEYHELVYRIRPYHRRRVFSCLSRLSSRIREWLDAPPMLWIVLLANWMLIAYGSRVTFWALPSPTAKDSLKMALFLETI